MAQLGIEKSESPSQVGKRRYARGRAYDPERYAEEMKAVEQANAAETAEAPAQAEEKPEQSQENTES